MVLSQPHKLASTQRGIKLSQDFHLLSYNLNAEQLNSPHRISLGWPGCFREETVPRYVRLVFPSVAACEQTRSLWVCTKRCGLGYCGSRSAAGLRAAPGTVPTPRQRVERSSHCREGTREPWGRLRSERRLKTSRAQRWLWRDILTLDLGREKQFPYQKKNKIVISREREESLLGLCCGHEGPYSAGLGELKAHLRVSWEMTSFLTNYSDVKWLN